MATTYAEWLQTDSALRNLGCSCLRPPATPHVCTVFTQLALFVHHDLHKLKDASDELILAHALKLDLQVLSPTIAMNFPHMDSLLATRVFDELLGDGTLCTALSTWCCLCGRQIDPRDMLQHLWNNHAKHGNRGGLFYKFLSFYQKRQQQCSVCNCHQTAVQCPVLLQLASLLAILHHGHGGQPDLRDVGGPEPVGEDGGGRGQADGKAPEIFHVEWREGPGKRKRKKRAGEDPEHARTESTPDSRTLLNALTRLVLRHEDTLQCLAMETDFFVFLSAGPGSVLPSMMAQTQTWQQTPTAERTHPLRILVLKTLLEELLKRIQKLQSTASSDPLIQTLLRLNFLAARAREGRIIHISTYEVEFPEAADGGSGGHAPDHGTSHTDSDQDAHPASARSPEQKIRSPTSPTADPEGHDHGHGVTVSHHSLADHTGPGSHSCQRDEGTLAPTQSFRTLATSAWTDAPSQLSSNTACTTSWQNAGTTVMASTSPPLRTLQNPAAACYMNSAATGLAWSALKANGLKADQWSNFPGALGDMADVSKGQSMLLWADGQWTTLLANWPNPFRQHDVVDFTHHLLQQTNPLFLSCCWESRLEDDGQLKVVDHNAQGCPLRLYICSEQKSTLPIDLQGLVSNWKPCIIRVTRPHRTSGRHMPAHRPL